VTARLRVDPVACDGIGQCALVAPDVVVLDRWGYPVVPEGPLRAGDLAAARRAVVSCPRKALWVEEHTRDERAVRPGPDAARIRS
jgi:ferredoxin